MSHRKCLLLYEPSMGLSPMLVVEIFEIIQKINQRKQITTLLVEQNARIDLRIVDHRYVMKDGRIIFDQTEKKKSDIKEFYLGLTEHGARKSYHYVNLYSDEKDG